MLRFSREQPLGNLLASDHLSVGESRDESHATNDVPKERGQKKLPEISEKTQTVSNPM